MICPVDYRHLNRGMYAITIELWRCEESFLLNVVNYIHFNHSRKGIYT